MSKTSRSARKRARSIRKSPRHSQAQRDAGPLLQLHAHWTVQAHPRYLEAAAFTWQH